jgi:hypothetical protein
MVRKFIILFTIFLAVISLVFSIRKNKEIHGALSLINKNEAILKDKEGKNLAFKVIYLENIFFRNLSIKGTFLGLNNTEISAKDVIRPNRTVAIFVSDSACLDCHREYISLLFKYFYKDAVIIRLGPLLDNQEFLEYRIWGLVGCSELEDIVNSKRPLIAFINSKNSLQYIFIPVDSDLDLFEKYLVININMRY